MQRKYAFQYLVYQSRNKILNVNKIIIHTIYIVVLFGNKHDDLGLQFE